MIGSLALGQILTPLESIGIVGFRKDLQFHREITRKEILRVIAFAVVSPLALLLRQHWVLVAVMHTAKLGGSVLIDMAHEFWPRLCLTKFIELFFQEPMLFNNIDLFYKDHWHSTTEVDASTKQHQRR